MKLERIIYTIRTIEKSVGLDSRYDDRMLVDMINRYRVVAMEMYLKEHHRIKQEWFQNLGVVIPEVVNSADDLLIQHTSVTFGKYELPKIVELPHQRTLMIRSTSKHQRVEEIERHLLFKMIEVEDEWLKEFPAYFREGNVLYIYNTEKVSIRVILENPLEGTTYDALVLPDGNIQSVQGIRRNLTVLDEYPADGTIISALILEILTKELKIEKNLIPDISVDSAETDEIIKSPI